MINISSKYAQMKSSRPSIRSLIFCWNISGLFLTPFGSLKCFYLPQGSINVHNVAALGSKRML
jgi:hypothetical protein